MHHYPRSNVTRAHLCTLRLCTHTNTHNTHKRTHMHTYTHARVQRAKERVRQADRDRQSQREKRERERENGRRAWPYNWLDRGFAMFDFRQACFYNHADRTLLGTPNCVCKGIAFLDQKNEKMQAMQTIITGLDQIMR